MRETYLRLGQLLWPQRSLEQVEIPVPLQLAMPTNGEIINYSHLGIISEKNISYDTRK